jgi:hypothetical protein
LDRVEFVHDAAEARNDDGGEAEIEIRRQVGDAHFHALATLGSY